MRQQISSAIVAPLLHEDDLLGVLWLDSHKIRHFKVTDFQVRRSTDCRVASDHLPLFVELEMSGMGKQR